MKHYFLTLIPFGVLLYVAPMVAFIVGALGLIVAITSYTLVANRNHYEEEAALADARRQEKEINILRIKIKSLYPIIHNKGFKAAHNDFFYKLDSRELNFFFAYDKSKRIMSMQGDPSWLEPGVWNMVADYFNILEKRDHMYGDEMIYDRMVERNRELLKRSWLIPYRVVGYVSLIATLVAVSDLPDYPTYFTFGLFAGFLYLILDIY